VDVVPGSCPTDVWIKGREKMGASVAARIIFPEETGGRFSVRYNLRNMICFFLKYQHCFAGFQYIPSPHLLLRCSTVWYCKPQRKAMSRKCQDK
jgi:hypothetical protein